jgi:hypothetical protein
VWCFIVNGRPIFSVRSHMSIPAKIEPSPPPKRATSGWAFLTF